MKAINLIEKALASTAEDETRELLSNFLRANTIAKIEKFDLSKYASKNEMQANLTGIYHDNGFRVATSGNILCAVENPYPAEYEGKIITPKGQIIDAQFPTWKSVIPQEEEILYFRFPMSVDYYLQKIKEEQVIAKITGGDVFVKICHAESSVFLDVKTFVLFLNFFKNFRRAKIGIKFYDKYSYIIAKDDRGNLCLLVCIIPPDNPDYLIEIKTNNYQF